MTADNPSTWTYVDGNGIKRSGNNTTDPSGNTTTQMGLRANGAPVESGNPLPAQRPPFALNNQAAVLCSGTPLQSVLVVPYNASRRVLHIFNRTTGAETVDLGPTNAVAVGSGIPLYAGGGFTFDGQGAVGPFYAISPVASTPLSYAEG